MTNPFDEEVTGWEEVTDSELYCAMCALVSDTGQYSSDKKKLVWTCPNGHLNTVEIDLD